MEPLNSKNANGRSSPSRRHQQDRDPEANRNRVIRIGIAVVSFAITAAVSLPWLSEYNRLASDASQMHLLHVESSSAKQQRVHLDEVETILDQKHAEANKRSIEPADIDDVRQTLVMITKEAGAGLRHLEISDGVVRSWAVDGDDPRETSMPLYAEASSFTLHQHVVQLQAAGSMTAIRTIIKKIKEQAWYSTTQSMRITPSPSQANRGSFEINFITYGLNELVKENEYGEEGYEDDAFAKLEGSKLR